MHAIETKKPVHEITLSTVARVPHKIDFHIGHAERLLGIPPNCNKGFWFDHFNERRKKIGRGSAFYGSMTSVGELITGFMRMEWKDVP